MLLHFRASRDPNLRGRSARSCAAAFKTTNKRGRAPHSKHAACAGLIPSSSRLTTLSYSQERTINLNFESLSSLDSLVVRGYKRWVKNAPQHWKEDGFLKNSSPIVVTSRYGQNAAIALHGNEQQEAAAWELDRDYSKISFLTVAIATSIM